MKNTDTGLAQLAQQGLEQLRSGKALEARGCFEQVLAADKNNLSIWLALAFACARLGDNDATLAAVDQALALEPHNLRALLFKGDHLEQTGQSRKALVFYQGALKVAATAGTLPADVNAALQRAQDNCDRFAGEYRDHLLRELQADGYRAGNSHPRFEQALAIAFGEKEVYLQQPTRFYYPELPQIQFYDTSAFPWLAGVESATDKIRTELRAVLNEGRRFSPYLQSNPDTVVFNDASNLDSDDWGAFYFYQEGHLVEDNALRCPATMAALALAPQPQVAGSTPHALFSRLAGQTRIPPHHGLINTRLICHLPLIVPTDCGGLRCGNEVQYWKEGKAYVFDDSIEHEAWNDSDEERIVLLFDIWRPELCAEERELISSMLHAVQRYEQN